MQTWPGTLTGAREIEGEKEGWEGGFYHYHYIFSSSTKKLNGAYLLKERTENNQVKCNLFYEMATKYELSIGMTFEINEG